MNPEKYNDIWKEIILKYIEDNNLKLTDNFRSLDELKEKIKDEYTKFRDQVKKYMYNPNGKIDRHKLGAIFFFVILKLLPFKRSKKSKRMRFSNEFSASHVAVSIVWLFLRDDAKKDNNISLFEKIKNGFKYPKVSQEYSDNQDYTYILAQLGGYIERDIAINRKSINYVNIFLVSNILFLIERYNIEINFL